MIAHNSDHKRIAQTILDIHMSIVSEQWTNYSCPMFLDFQTSVCRYTQNYPFLVCLYMHCVGDQVIKRERVGAPLVCSTSPHVLAFPKAGSGFLASSVVVFFVVFSEFS